jgi:hypothetical protein
VDLILNHFAGITSTGTNNLLSLGVVENEINTNRRPTIIRWGWDSGGGHILVMHGVAISTNCPVCFTNIWLMDPLNGPTVNSYAWVCRGGTHTWTHSLPISTAPPTLQVTPGVLDFGQVEVGSSVTQQVVLENIGGGWVNGTSSVAAPFGIASGATYQIPSLSGILGRVRYSPTAPGTNSETVTFTGGGGASCTATGSASLLLEVALDAPYLTFDSGPAPSGPFWKRDTAQSHDGVDAAKSGPVTAGGQSWFSSTITGPGIASFWWKVSSGTGGFLSFSVGGVQQAVISGEVDWTLRAAVVPSGSQSLKWTYTRPMGSPQGQDAGWVDQLTYGPAVAVDWGDNFLGQLKVPAGLTNVVAVAGGGTHSLVLKGNGTVAGWDLGYSSAPAGLTNVVAIAAGDRHDLALQADGRVVAWGLNTYGQTNVPAGLTNAVAVAGGFNHSLALNSDGMVTAWGDNSSGQTNVPPNLTNVVAIAAGRHSLVLKGDGTVVAWGDNASGQTNVPPALSNVTAIAAGLSHSLALRDGGVVVAWGDNSSGQTNVPPDLTNVVAIAAGGSHSLALKADGTVVAWGSNSSGQTNVPAWLTNVVAVAAGGSHCFALMRVGSPADMLCLSNPVSQGNVFTVSVPTVRGRAYFLEFKDSLAAPKWTMRPPLPGDGSTRQLTDPFATPARRFYRVRQQ